MPSDFSVIADGVSFALGVVTSDPGGVATFVFCLTFGVASTAFDSAFAFAFFTVLVEIGVNPYFETDEPLNSSKSATSDLPSAYSFATNDKRAKHWVTESPSPVAT